MKKIYVFGNPLVEIDRSPLQLIKALKRRFPDIVFEIVDPNENFPPEGERDLAILDTVVGIREPMILDLKDFDPPAGGQQKTPISPHDYDLLMHLLLLRKMGKIEKVKIIGVPTHLNFESCALRVKELVKS